MQESRCSAASARALPLPTPTARSPLMVCRVPKCCRRCHWPMSSCSHHLPATLPNAGILRGGEHGSFVRGHTASSSMKRCSLGMTLRCVLAGRHSARDTCSTLPARGADLSRFARERYADVPAVLQRFTRFVPRFDYDMETTCEHVVVQSPRSCRVGGSRGGPTRTNVWIASRACKKSSYQSP